jgi:glyoxylate reductase
MGLVMTILTLKRVHSEVFQSFPRIFPVLRRKPGISVSSTPIAVNNATADIAMWLMIGALRRITAPMISVKAAKWRGPNFELGHEPQNKVLGILGMGGIGTVRHLSRSLSLLALLNSLLTSPKELAQRALSFELNILYHNRSPLPASHPLSSHPRVSLVPFAQLLSQSDVLSLNLSLTPQTKHIISTKEFAAMKDGIVIINTARGALIDEEALVEALKSGKVWSAGLDVYENEPKIQKELLQMDNVVLLPHIGTGTVETQVRFPLLCLLDRSPSDQEMKYSKEKN